MAQSLTEKQTFIWEGTDRRGARLKGKTEALNESMMRVTLRKQGINPIRVRKQSTLFATRKRKRIKAADIAIFSRQIATMMSAGVPLVQSLDIIANGAENPALTALVHTIRDGIESGGTLSEALGKHPRKTEAIKAKVRKALFYPSAVIVVAIIVMGILLYFVVPQFESLFRGFGAELPAFTLMVIGLSAFVQTWWWAMLGAIALGGFALTRIHRRSRGFRRFVDRFMLRLPVVGDILYKAAVARFARTLSTMFAAGVPLVEAMESVAKAAGNIVFEEAIFQMREQVSSGQQLQLAMSNTGLFPSMAVQMVSIGEESGALDAMCAKVADFFEAEVDNQVDSLSSLLEPLIMAVIGVLVGGLVVAMYLPIFKLGSVV
jgi:type IV pilus assembly protein PilC